MNGLELEERTVRFFSLLISFAAQEGVSDKEKKKKNTRL